MAIKVRTQAEFEAAIARGEAVVCEKGEFRLFARAGEKITIIGSARLVVAVGGAASVVACDNSSVVACGNSSVEAWDNSSVEAWDNSSVVARDNSSVVAWDNSSVVARGNSSVVARDNSSVEAWDNSSVVARGNSSVVAWGHVFIRWFGALRIKASLTVIVAKMRDAPGNITGGRVLECRTPHTAQEWCEQYGVDIRDGVAVLYKALNDDFTSPRGTSYAPGAVPVATDWDGGVKECGGGLHFSPSPTAALCFHREAKRFAACPVRLTDIAIHNNPDYPAKIKARGCCSPVWEVDRLGNKVVDVAP